MPKQIKEKMKINFANLSEKGLRRQENNDSLGKFPGDHANLATPKGQLFIVADSKSGNPGGKDPGKMCIDTVQKNFFSYPSDDIVFSLQRAFDTANRQIYQYSQANGLHRKIGATCSALVMTEKSAYVAHVGDCRVFRVNARKVEQVTHDHIRIIEMMARQTNGKPVPVANGSAANRQPAYQNSHSRPNGSMRQNGHAVHNGHSQTNGRSVPNGKPIKRPVLTRALGIKLGIKIDTISKIPIQRDDCFVICSDGLRGIRKQELQSIVLSSSPQRACQRLLELAKSRGVNDDISLHIIKIYHHYEQPIEMYSHVSPTASGIANWPIYFMLCLLTATIGILSYEPFMDRFTGFSINNAGNYSMSKVSEQADRKPGIVERNYLLRADEYLLNQRWDDALNLFSAVLRNFPGHPQATSGVAEIAIAFERMGDSAFEQQRWDVALLYYKKAKNLKPNDRRLRNLIAESKRRFNRPRSLLAAKPEKQPERLEVRQSSVFNEALKVPSTTMGIETSQWNILGLDEFEDFNVKQGVLTFSDNIRIKKAFHQEAYDGVEVEVLANALSGSRNGKYGIIFGHNMEAANPYKNFYLFSVDNNGNYALQEVTERSVRILVAEQIQPGILRDYGAIHLKVKYIGNLILLYANGELLKMTPTKRMQTGGVGLYVDPKLKVEFSDFKASPANRR